MFGNARIIRFAALSLALLTVAASAKTFTVALDLSGYPNIQFDIGRRFSAIQSVTFTCSGTMLAGLDHYGQPFSGQVVLWLRANPGYKIAEGPLAGQSTYPAAEPFTGQSSFRSLIGATWDFLLDGTGDGWFEIEPSLFLPEQQPLSLPSAAIGSAALIIEATPVPTPIIYVDDDAPTPGDGRSWQTAYKYLQDALTDANAAPKPVEIRVAQGTYHPDEDTLHPDGTGDKQASFHLITGVTLKGGYAGITEPDANAHDIRLYEVILSGDLNGDDVVPASAPAPLTDPRSENSRHVMLATGVDATAIVDGFTITAGYAFDGSVSGAGLDNRQGTPILYNCTFVRNIAEVAGGGIHSDLSGTVTLKDCRFFENGAQLGGGMSGKGVLVNCAFIGNHGRFGGALRGMGTFTECSFVANTAGAGGAVYVRGSGKFVNCRFDGNLAWGAGGGGLHASDCDLYVLSCSFVRNIATYRAGGAVHTSTSSVAARSVLAECHFRGNSASSEGGAVYNSSTDLVLDNCLLVGNRAGVRGGAICNYPGDGNQPGGTLRNCSLADNTAPEAPCIWQQQGTLCLTNSILWNGPENLSQGVDSQVIVLYSAVFGGWPGDGNMMVDPCFVDPGHWDPNGTPDDTNDDFWVDGDYHLKSQAGRWDPATQSWVIDDVTSPCIDAGDPMTPIGHEPFPNGGRINMGAYGGTAEASKSYFNAPPCETIMPGDINGDCKVDLADFAILALHWLETSQ